MKSQTAFAIGALLTIGTTTAQTWRPLRMPPRTFPCLAEMPGTGRVLLFGGTPNGGASSLQDSWTYDGQEWVELRPLQRPPARMRAAMVYSSATNRVVLFGGHPSQLQPNVLFGDTWEFDGTTWTQRATPATPLARMSPVMVDDILRGRVLMYGGFGVGSGALAPISDAWEYYAGDWHPRPAPSSTLGLSPYNTTGLAMAYDLGRARSVLFGWNASGGAFETWLHNGVNWQQQLPQHAPSHLSSVAAWYDWTRGAVTLLVSDAVSNATTTWIWSGADWVPIVTAATSSPMDPMVGFDFARGRALATAPGDADGLTSDILEFDGSQWSRTVHGAQGVRIDEAAAAFDSARGRTIAVSPSGLFGTFAEARVMSVNGGVSDMLPSAHRPLLVHGQAMVFDSARGQLVLHAASDGTNFDQTWVHDGQDWRAVAVGPPPRTYHAMAYDSIRRRVVLFGGRSNNIYPIYLADTWEFDGSAWLPVSGPAPSGRELAAMAFQTSRRQCVLFGGYNSPTVGLTDTWTYDGAWHLVNTPGTNPRTGHSMVEDPVRGTILLYGGAFPQTCEFDGAQWTYRPTPVQPSIAASASFHGYSLVYDSTANRFLMIGPGIWEYQPPATPTWTTYGPGCTLGAGPTLTLAGGQLDGPALGSTFPLLLTAQPALSSPVLLTYGYSLDKWLGVPLPVDLGSFGGPGCNLWVPATDMLLVGLANGTATLNVQVPNDPRLAGMAVGAQAVLVDPAAATLFGGISNAICVRVY